MVCCVPYVEENGCDKKPVEFLIRTELHLPFSCEAGPLRVAQRAETVLAACPRPRIAMRTRAETGTRPKNLHANTSRDGGAYGAPPTQFVYRYGGLAGL